MGGLNAFGVIDTGNPFTVLDPFVSGAYNNGARMPLGTKLEIPLNPTLVGSPAKGVGSYLTVRYVRYLSTANPATVGGPAPVYYTDESFTTVSGVSTESLGGVNLLAGWLLPNTSANSIGAGFTAAALNGNFVFIGLVGFIPGAISVAATVAGDNLIGAATNFTVARVAAGTAPTNTVGGVALTAVSGGLSDIYAILPW